MSLLIDIFLDGLTIGMIYVLAAAGLSIIFGVMDVLNISHGELFALGSYLAFAFFATGFAWTWMFWVAIVLVPIIIALVGMAMERITIRPLYGRGHLDQALVTFGALLIIYDLRWLIWGRESHRVPGPPGLEGSISLFVYSYSAFNIFIIVFGAILVAATWIVLNYTTFGMIVRAGAQDREMVTNLGIDINHYYTLLFGFGMALAGVGGVVLSAYHNVNLEMGHSILIPAFVVVVIGGMGSFKGAVIGGLGVGVLQSFMSVNWHPWFPQWLLSGIEIFIIMIIVLLVMPRGLFGNPHWHVPTTSASDFLAGASGEILGPKLRRRLGIGVIALLALVPVGAGSFYTSYSVTIVQYMLIWAILAISLDLVMGYAGLISLGHAMFYGMGGYTAMLVFMHLTESIIAGLLFAVALSALIAIPVGYLSIQVRGPYFILITLGFAELFYHGVYKFQFTGGDGGLFGVDPVLGLGPIAIPLEGFALGIWPLTIEARHLTFYVVLGLAVAAFLLSRRMINAPFGSVLKSVRESEKRAKFVGYNVQKFKLQAFVISGAIGGLAGGLYSSVNEYAAPALFHWLISGELILMVVFGGMGTLYGAMLGAATFVGFADVLSAYVEAWRLLFGILFIVFVIFVPRGLVSIPATVHAHWQQYKRRSREPPTSAPDTGPESDD